MQMRPSIQINSVLKALGDVVLPAVDPANKPAQEQIRLVIGMLTLMAQQLPLQFRFDCDELARLIELSHQVQGISGGVGTTAAVGALADISRSSAATLEQAKAAPEKIEQSVRALRAATGDLVTQAFNDGDAVSRSKLSKAVLAMSQEQLLRDRSLLLMQGWEPDPKAIPPIASLLDGAGS